MIQTARNLVNSGWYIIPTHGIINGQCTCGVSNCKDAGKHPATAHGCKDASNAPQLIERWWSENPVYNPAIVTGVINNCFVLEVEADGLNELQELEQKYGVLPETLMAKSGGGGIHYFLQYPDDGTKIGNRIQIDNYLIDCRGDGGYVVAAGAMHKTGNHYEWINPTASIVNAPAWVIELVTSTKRFAKQPQQQQTSIIPPHAGTTPQSVLDRARAYLLKCPPAISGQAGHKTAIKTVLKIVRGFDIPPDDALQLLKVWNQNCQPPWSDKELLHKIAEANRDDLGWGARGDLLQKDSFLLTDYGNAERLIHSHGQDLRYCYAWKAWLVWNGKCWKKDSSGEVERRAKMTVREMYKVAANMTDDTRREQLVTWAKKSERKDRLKAMISLAQSETGVAVMPDMLDNHPMLLNVKNGTIDLTTGILHQHNRNELLTQMASANYDPQATCPTWDRFLHSIFDGDVELIGFVQRLIGYAISGDVKEQILAIFWGLGSNGKSTFMNLLRQLLGDYWLKADKDLLVANGNQGHSTTRMDLFSKRFVLCSETEDGHKLNESFVKDITGGESIRGRKLYQDSWEFEPTHKIILCTNHKPMVRGNDHAIWRRLLLVPFNVRFWNPDKRETGADHLRADKTLSQRLEAELPGILTWAVSGCLSWQKYGLCAPQVVIQATAEYQDEQDVLGQFISDRLSLLSTTSESVSIVYEEYKRWCEAKGHRYLSQTKFSPAMEEHGIKKHRTGAGMLFEGVQLSSPIAVFHPAGQSSVAGGA